MLSNGPVSPPVSASRISPSSAKTGASAANAVSSMIDHLNETIRTSTGGAEQKIGTLASSTATTIQASVESAERSLTGLSSGVTTVPCQTPGSYFGGTGGVSSNILDQIRPFRGYRSINMITPHFNSNYHSLQTF